jgi:hypothetical protein
MTEKRSEFHRKKRNSEITKNRNQKTAANISKQTNTATAGTDPAGSRFDEQEFFVINIYLLFIYIFFPLSSSG